MSDPLANLDPLVSLAPKIGLEAVAQLRELAEKEGYTIMVDGDKIVLVQDGHVLEPKGTVTRDEFEAMIKQAEAEDLRAKRWRVESGDSMLNKARITALAFGGLSSMIADMPPDALKCAMSDPKARSVPRHAKYEPFRPALETGRNDPCHCGSGIKFKKCCISVQPRPKKKEGE